MVSRWGWSSTRPNGCEELRSAGASNTRPHLSAHGAKWGAHLYAPMLASRWRVYLGELGQAAPNTRQGTSSKSEACEPVFGKSLADPFEGAGPQKHAPNKSTISICPPFQQNRQARSSWSEGQTAPVRHELETQPPKRDIGANHTHTHTLPAEATPTTPMPAHAVRVPLTRGSQLSPLLEPSRRVLVVASATRRV